MSKHKSVTGGPRHADYIELSPNGEVVALNVPAGQWHTVKALESGTIIVETKDGAYEPKFFRTIT